MNKIIFSLKGCTINDKSYVISEDFLIYPIIQKSLFSKNMPEFWQLNPNSTKVMFKAFKIVTTQVGSKNAIYCQ